MSTSREHINRDFFENHGRLKKHRNSDKTFDKNKSPFSVSTRGVKNVNCLFWGALHLYIRHEF
jgi:hypothetical protein